MLLEEFYRERAEKLIKEAQAGKTPASSDLEEPQLLAVSYRKDVTRLHRALLDRGLRPTYVYTNTPAKTMFFFRTANAENLKLAAEIADQLGIKHKLI